VRSRRVTGGARPAAWVLALALALSACGAGGHDGPRERLAHYIRSVQRVEVQMRAPLAQISRVGHQVIGLGSSTPRTVLRARLDAAIRALVALRARLAALPAPRGAATLRLLVLRLADRQAALAHELAQIIVYPAAFASAVRPLGAATRTLARALALTSGPSAAAVYAARARALEAFAGVAKAVASSLRRISAPAVYEPGYRGELRALAMMRAAAGRLAAAPRSGGGAGATAGAAATAALRQLDAAFALGASPSLHRAEIAAVRAYDRRVQGLSALVARIQGERQRLSATVG
jgi:hypothetical protein